MQELINKIKGEIIDQLNLEGLTVDEIDEKEPLFGEGLGLDSIDALELILLLERNYGIKLKNPQDGRKIFASVETMARFIQDNQANTAQK